VRRPSRDTRIASALVAFASALGGCEAFEPRPPPPQVVVVRVTSDPGVPVKDAVLRFDGKDVGKTDADGVGKLKLEGTDGETFPIAVACPDGFRSPAKPVDVTLRRLESEKLPEYFASCPPSTRSVVVAVRAENAPNIPVVYLGREVARTDGSGAAHVHLRLKPDEPFELMLKTDGDEGKLLRPENPTASFVVKDHDDVFSFDQRFDKAQEKRRVYKAKPKGPVRIP
jgi:hypothetical protein